MRGQDMRCAGNTDIITPNMDRLAAEGLMFRNAISNCPLCVPARGSLITGRYPLSHKAISNDLPLPAEEIGIAEVLKEEGYATGYIGKWHLDGVPRDKFTPPGGRRQGFDYWAAWECHHNYFKGRYYTDEPKPIFIEGYEPDFQTTLAIDYIRRNADRPFCLFLSWGPPHAPYHLVPQKYRDMYDPSKIRLRPNCIGADRRTIADYYAHITALDYNLGRLLDVLDELKLSERTIVVFTSDHGDMLWSQGKLKKEQPWEESILIPFIIRWRGRIPEGKVTDELIGIVDMMPSLLSLVGARIPDCVEGTDLSKVMLGGKADGRNSVLLTIPLPGGQGYKNGVREWRGVRTKRYTYARLLDGTVWVLYDNEKDPYQLNNLAGKREAESLQEEMEAELQYWLEKTGDEFLPWDEHLKQLGIVELWHESEKYLGGRNPRLVRG